jgi:anti-sigma factor RsiW
MECRFPPSLTPDQLSAALDGLADPDTQSHLERCPACASRLEAARRFEQRLSQLLYRWDCPSPQRLGDYYLNPLSSDETTTITQHLRQCVRCDEEFAALRAFMEVEQRPVDQPPERAARRPPPGQPRWREIIAHLLPQAPALALRGSATGPLTAEAGDIRLLLDVKPAPGSAVTLDGTVMAPDQDRWEGALVHLRREGAILQMAAVDDLGGFRCEAFPPGPTEVRIVSAEGQAIVLPDVDLVVP